MVHFCLFSNSTRLLAATTLRNVLGILRTFDTSLKHADYRLSTLSMLITALLITSMLIPAINMLYSHITSCWRHKRSRRDSLRTRKYCTHHAGISLYHFQVVGFFSCPDSPMSALFSLSLCVSEPSDQKRAAKETSDKTKNWTEKHDMRVDPQKTSTNTETSWH